MGVDIAIREGDFVEQQATNVWLSADGQERP
jgi:hypothetical protein